MQASSETVKGCQCYILISKGKHICMQGHTENLPVFELLNVRNGTLQLLMDFIKTCCSLL